MTISNAAEAAERVTAHTLITCWLRERDGWTFDSARGVVLIPLPRWNASIEVGVGRWTTTLRHRLRLPAVLAVAGRPPRELDLATLATLLTDGLGASRRVLPRILDSAAMVDAALRQRSGEIDRLWGPDPLTFGESEQALLLGHCAHPAAKSRPEMGAPARQLYSPELAGSFALRWLAVDAALVQHDSATDRPAPVLAEQLLRSDPSTDRWALDAMRRAAGPDRVLIPAHPYQVDALSAADDTAGLFDSGAIVDLGALGGRWLPTTSLRTLYRPDAKWQLKFSLSVSITNSVRVTLAKELDRAVEAARLSQTEVGMKAAAVAPDFVLVHDAAYLTLRTGDQVINEFSVLFRENRWRAGGPLDVTALTTLCQDHPHGGRSRLHAIVAAIAEREGRAVPDVAREWFARFCDVVVRSLIRLYLDVGLCFEAHQQNTLVELDGGWPVRGVYRDSQGYFHREAAHADLTRVVPGLGEATESIFPEELADERLAYYLFANLTLGVANALGDCADEAVLLADLRRVLEAERAAGGRYPATLLDRLLDDETWPLKANLLTRAHDMDELVGDIVTQSVYVTTPNPLRMITLSTQTPPSRGLQALQSTQSPRSGSAIRPPSAVRLAADPNAVRLTAEPLDVDAHSDLIQDWMNRPHVAPWWAAERVDTRGYLKGLTHSMPWLFRADGVPFGYVETYRVAEDPLAAYFDADPRDMGWHVLVGPEQYLGTGIPRRMARAMLRYLFNHTGDAGRVVCEPDIRNTRMHRFCERLGFRVAGELELPDKRALLMICTRTDFEAVQCSQK